MIGKFRSKEEDPLDDEIEGVLVEMAEYGPSAPEYPTLLAYLERLTTLKEGKTSKRRVSPDTIAIIVGNIVVVGIMVGYEHGHVMTSKAFGFTLKNNQLHQ